MRTIPHKFFQFVTLLAVLCVGLPSQAEEIIRDRSMIMSMPIEGVTLNMTPKQAFEHLTSSGFTAVNLAGFKDWTRTGITLRKEGKMKPDGFPKWFIEISLGREGRRLINVTESSQRLDRTNFDVVTVIEQVRRHFDIAKDEGECRSSTQEGVCRVVDVTTGKIAYGIQVRPTTKSAQLMIMTK